MGSVLILDYLKFKIRLRILLSNDWKKKPHRDTVALGKEIKGICHGRQLTWVFDQDEAAINCVKKLLELEQNVRK